MPYASPVHLFISGIRQYRPQIGKLKFRFTGFRFQQYLMELLDISHTLTIPRCQMGGSEDLTCAGPFQVRLVQATVGRLRPLHKNTHTKRTTIIRTRDELSRDLNIRSDDDRDVVQFPSHGKKRIDLRDYDLGEDFLRCRSGVVVSPGSVRGP